MTAKKTAPRKRKPNPYLQDEVAQKFHQYLLGMSKAEREALAERCGTKADQLMFVATKLRSMRLDIAIELDRETAGFVTMQELRPDVDWNHVKTALART